MRYLEEHPVDFDAVDADGQAITLIRTVYRTDEAAPEPGAFERGIMKLWRGIRFAAVSVAVVAVVGAYPAMTVRGHQLDASMPSLAEAPIAWTSDATGLMNVAIARETDGAGWIGDHAIWRPEARLTALPAWQAGLASGLSDVSRARAEAAKYEGAPDRDLMMASRLLAVREDGRMGARLAAAMEAFQRYDGRLAQGLAVQPTGASAALAQLDLIDNWSTNGREALRVAIADPDTVLASVDAVSALYELRGRAQAASIVLAGLAAEDPDLMAQPDIAAARATAQETWRAVAEMSPLFVGNAEPGAIFPGNDLMSMAYLLDEARAATLALRVEIESFAPVEAPEVPDGSLLAKYPSPKPQMVP